MRVRREVASALLLLVVATGCAVGPAGQGDPGDGPATGSDDPSAGATSGDGPSTQPLERTEVAAPDVGQTCAAVYEESGADPGSTLEARVRLMLASYPFELDDDQAQAYVAVDAELTGVIEDAPTAIGEQLDVVRRPFADVTESVADGGGALVVDTAGVESALEVVEALCAEGGYDV